MSIPNYDSGCLFPICLLSPPLSLSLSLSFCLSASASSCASTSFCIEYRRYALDLLSSSLLFRSLVVISHHLVFLHSLCLFVSFLVSRLLIEGIHFTSGYEIFQVLVLCSCLLRYKTSLSRSKIDIYIVISLSLSRSLSMYLSICSGIRVRPMLLLSVIQLRCIDRRQRDMEDFRKGAGEHSRHMYLKHVVALCHQQIDSMPVAPSTGAYLTSMDDDTGYTCLSSVCHTEEIEGMRN
jgi:hypothetical protein